MKLRIGGFSKRFHQQDKTGYQELILGQRFGLHIHVQGPNYSSVKGHRFNNNVFSSRHNNWKII